MIYVIIGISLLFIGIGFSVTENNADSLLAGYNTMSDEQKKNVDIKSYIPYFRKFHLFLGISLFVLGSLIYYFIDSDIAGIFLGIYPTLAYVYFIWAGAKYSKIKDSIMPTIAIVILLTVGALITYDFVAGNQENVLTVNDSFVEIDGSYGEQIKKSEIKSIVLVNGIPKIKLKINGLALENIEKGYFKTEGGEKVKLILNSSDKPIILITKKDNQKIYYSAKSKSNREIFKELMKELGR